VILQLRPLLEVREARTHISRFKPRIAPTKAAVRPYLTGRTFVPVARLRLVDGLLEDLPAFSYRAGAQIIAWNGEGGAEVHFPVGSNRKTTLAAGTFDEGLPGTWVFFLGLGPPVREHFLIDTDLYVGGKSI